MNGNMTSLKNYNNLLFKECKISSSTSQEVTVRLNFEFCQSDKLYIFDEIPVFFFFVFFATSQFFDSFNCLSMSKSMAQQPSMPHQAQSNMGEVKNQLYQALNIMFDSQRDMQDANVRKQFNHANKFLMQFAKNNEAWTVCLNILSDWLNQVQSTSSSNAPKNNITLQVLNYAANTLLSNLLSNYKVVPSKKRQEIGDLLLQFINIFAQYFLMSFLTMTSYNNNNNNNNNRLNDPSDCQSFRYILNKTSSLYVFLVLEANQGASLLEKMFKDWNSIELPKNMTQLWCNYEILRAFGLELKENHVPMRIMNQTQNIIKKEFPTIFLNIIKNSITVTFDNNHEMFQKIPNIRIKLLDYILECFKHWVTVMC